MSPLIPLEDTWVDIIRKARKGLALPESEILHRSGLEVAQIAALESGRLKEEQLGRLASALRLGPERLLALARGEYHPGQLELPDGMAMFSTPWHDFQVHSYLLWEPGQEKNTSPAAAFDTGSDASEMLLQLRSRHIVLEQIFLTHGHGDHVFDLDRLLEKSQAVAWMGEGEDVPGVESFTAGQEFSLGSLRIVTRSTWGHAKVGITYVIHGLERPVAIVGDALFAGSMGGPNISYKACLETNRRELLSLPPETLLCPGHGPLTTVALERTHNPFFPEEI